MEKSPRVLTTQIRVQSHELDSFGHVNNAVYLKYLETARCDYMRQAGLSFNDFDTWKAMPVVVEAYLRYYYPLIADDLIILKGEFVEWQRSSFLLKYEIVKDDGTQVLSAKLRFMFVNESGKPTRIPEIFKKSFS